MIQRVSIPVVGVNTYGTSQYGLDASVFNLEIRLNAHGNEIEIAFPCDDAFRRAVHVARLAAARFTREILGVDATASGFIIEGPVPSGVIVEASYSLPLAIGIVSLLIGVPMESRICASGNLDSTGISFSPTSGGEAKARACHASGFSLFIFPETVPGISGLRCFRIESAVDAIVGTLTWVWPFQVSRQLGDQDSEKLFTNLYRMLLMKVRMGQYPRGVGSAVVRNDGLVDLIRRNETSWLIAVSQFVPGFPFECYDDLGLLVFPKCGWLSDLKQADEKIASLLKEMVLDPPIRTKMISISAVHNILRFLDQWKPDLTEDLWHQATSAIADLLTHINEQLSSLRADCEHRLADRPTSQRNQIISEFYHAHPEYGPLSNLAGWLTIRRQQGLGHLDNLFEEMESPRLRIEGQYDNKRFTRFRFRVPDLPDNPNDYIQHPVALIEDSKWVPDILRKADYREEADLVYMRMPNGREILSRLGSSNLLTFYGIEIFWMDGLGVWPPSIDFFYFLEYLAQIETTLIACDAVADVGSGTGALGVFLSSRIKKGRGRLPSSHFFDVEPLSEILSAANWARNFTSGELREIVPDLCRGANDLFRFHKGDAISTLPKATADTPDGKFDLLVSAVPYLPYTDELSSDLWRAVNGIDLAVHLLRFGSQYCKRMILQYSSIADGSLAGEIIELQSKQGVKVNHILDAPMVAFKIPPLYPFLSPGMGVGDRDLLEEIGRPYLNRISDALTLSDKSQIERDGGFRYFHQLRFLDITF